MIGATSREGSVGRSVFENLALFSGPVFPVNPFASEVLGQKSFANVRDIGAPVDLAIIITPAATVPGIVADCVQAGVKGAVIISAGFKETGESGAALERQIRAEAQKNGMRIIGPNCLGVIAPHSGLNATFAAATARPGRVAFLSQSGALCAAILDWSFRENVGFSAFVSTGSMLDVGWGDLIRHFGDDPATSSIVIYMESVGDARAFLCAACDVAAKKPIVVIKVGRTEAAARAAASHTGAMTGSDAALDAALRQAGVLRVDTIEEVFDIAEILAKQRLPSGPRLGIVTNAGGPGALATDCVANFGGQVAALSEQTLAALNALLPPHWSHANPVDVLGDADAERFAGALRIVAADPEVDGLLAILTPQAMTNATAVATRIAAIAHTLDKPLLCSWMGAASVEEGRRILNAESIPTYDYPDGAARAFVFMWERRRRLELLRETQRAAERFARTVPAGDGTSIIASARSEGRTLLTETEAKRILKACGIPVAESFVASSEDEAVAIAESIGFPVVAKLHSTSITHKTDTGGVKLNLISAQAVRDAWRDIHARISEKDFGGLAIQRMVLMKGYELILGASTDPQFGPVLLFGAGGTLVEVFQDRALVLPPLCPELARHWIAETRISRALHGVRGQHPIDLDQLAEILVRFANLMLTERSIAEIDVNPLLASADGIIALDARIVLHPAATAEPDLPPAALLTCG